MAKGGRKKESKKIDVTKFKAVVKGLGLTLSALSTEMGFRWDYLSKACQQGSVSKFTMQYLKNKYNISYEDYKYGTRAEIVEQAADDAEKTVEAVQPVVNNIVVSLTKEELSEIIYQAVYSAMTHAWKDA